MGEQAREAGLADLAALFSPAQRADPYPAYADLRVSRPVWQLAERFFVLSRHRDCAGVLRDPRFGHAEGDELAARRRAPLDAASGRDRPPVRSFLGLNPPDHTRLRRLVSRSFTPRRVDELVPQVRGITDELLARVRDHDAEVVDLVEEIASPLPVRVICELLGVPTDDRARLVDWSHALAKGLDPGFLLTETDRRAQARARDEFATYLREAIAKRRRSPGSDLLSALVTTHVEGDAMTEAELVATCILLLIAGHETTTSLIGNGMLALLTHPEQLDHLRERPELAGNAVEELLRFDPPVQVTMRMALHDATVAGVAVKEGTFVLLLVGSANRDPDAHADPDRLDISRPPGAHLAFGQGIHFCLGAPLARMEAQVALRALTQSASRIELAGAPDWKDTAVLRGVKRLGVRMTVPRRSGGKEG